MEKKYWNGCPSRRSMTWATSKQQPQGHILAPLNLRNNLLKKAVLRATGSLCAISVALEGEGMLARRYNQRPMTGMRDQWTTAGRRPDVFRRQTT